MSAGTWMVVALVFWFLVNVFVYLCVRAPRQQAREDWADRARAIRLAQNDRHARAKESDLNAT